MKRARLVELEKQLIELILNLGVIVEICKTDDNFREDEGFITNVEGEELVGMEGGLGFFL